MAKFICALAVIAMFTTGCVRNGGGSGGGFSGNSLRVFTALADFSGARIASEAGSVLSHFIDRVIPNVEHQHFVSLADIVAALLADKVDAISLDMPVALYLTARNNNLSVFPYIVAEDNYGFAVPKGSLLAVKGNEILSDLRANGTIAELEKIWFSADDSGKFMPLLAHRHDFDGSAGTIRYGCQNTLIPMAYATPEGDPVGFDLDIASRIAYEMNMHIKYVNMPFGALLPALASGEVDMAGGSMSMTEERMKSVDFIGPYFDGGITLVVKSGRLGKLSGRF